MQRLIRYSYDNPIIILLAIWLIACGIIVYRLNTLGAFASLSAAKSLVYARDYGKANPASVRLDQSYSQWAIALNWTDPANYIKAGLGFADGQGMSLKNISPEEPNNKTYIPYYFQSPGAPIIIGAIIKLFGEKHVWPYFIFIATIHFITAICTVILAKRFIENKAYVLGAGVLSLLSLPVLDFNFGLGLFSSEPIAALLVGFALLFLSVFWQGLERSVISIKEIFFCAIGFGCSLALAGYCRDVYTAFANFCCLVFILVALIKIAKFKQILLFVLISTSVLFAVQYPCKRHNLFLYREFAISGSTYCNYAMWYTNWTDYKEAQKWAWDAGIGLGDYLAHEKSEQITTLLNKDKKAGSILAAQSLIEAVAKKPLQALLFKLKVYDTLWCGQRSHIYIYLWCLISTFSFIAFLFLTRFKFIPELWLFPLFLICLSPLIHYEHRYAQPFFLFVTPITVMYVLKYLMGKYLNRQKS